MAPSKTLSRIFLLLYLQFAFYWATIAMGMYANYYYAVPSTLGSDPGSIITEILTAPDIVVHVVFAILSTGMSIPIIYYLRKVGLGRASYLHMGAITSRMAGFIGGPLFMFYASSGVGDPFSANLSTFVMAAAFMLAVILSFMSRIFIVREDVRIKYTAANPQAISVRP